MSTPDVIPPDEVSDAPTPLVTVGAKLIVAILGTMPQAQSEEIAALAGIFFGHIVSEVVEDIIDRRFGDTAEIGKQNDELEKAFHSGDNSISN